MEAMARQPTETLVLFKMGPFSNATNNIGEFLALVHGIAILEKDLKKKIIARETKPYHLFLQI